MPHIMPIKALKNTSKLSKIVHKESEPIFITKNGHSDLVIMSTELYENIAKENQIDQAIYEAEKDIKNGGHAMSLTEARSMLNKKYYGQI